MQQQRPPAGGMAAAASTATAASSSGGASEVCSLGAFLAGRLVEVGVSHAFGVPGDFNLTLLDELVAKEGLTMIWTTNELNAGYAADGFARRAGVGAAVVTYGVGGLSVINACAGCFAEDLPVIFISGGPNSNDFAANHIIHHTIGSPDLGQQYRAFREVTCAAVVVQHLSEAHHQIDHAISQALIHQKPCYIEVCCNLAGLRHPSFLAPAVPMALPGSHTNAASLAAAVEASAAAISNAAKPVLLGGAALRPRKRRHAFAALAAALGCGVAVTAGGKSLFPDGHEQSIGYYWGAISSSCTAEVVESADLVIQVGCVWDDYSTLGYSTLLQDERSIRVGTDRVTLRGGATWGCIDCEAFLYALAEVVPRKPASLANYRRMVLPPKPAGAAAAHAPPVSARAAEAPYGEQGGAAGDELAAAAAADPATDEPAAAVAAEEQAGAEAPAPAIEAGSSAAAADAAAADADPVLTTQALYQQVQELLTPGMCVLTETGDSWFHTMRLRLPEASDFVIQRRYGSIGWSVGATLGYSLASERSGQRLLAFIGDGSFQAAASDASSLLRYGTTRPIVFLINNTSYVIEEMIHPGVYNALVNWSYVDVLAAMQHHRHPSSGSGSDVGGGGSRLLAARVATEGQLAAALRAALAPENAGKLAFLECVLDPQDCSPELLLFGARVAAANGRPPNPQ